jgi:hypothetical protein
VKEELGNGKRPFYFPVLPLDSPKIRFRSAALPVMDFPGWMLFRMRFAAEGLIIKVTFFIGSFHINIRLKWLFSNYFPKFILHFIRTIICKPENHNKISNSGGSIRELPKWQGTKRMNKRA